MNRNRKRAERTGQFQYCVLTPRSTCESGEIYLLADRSEVSLSGALIFYGKNNQIEDSKEQTLISFAPHTWECFYASSGADGGPICVVSWPGHIWEGEGIEEGWSDDGPVPVPWPEMGKRKWEKRKPDDNKFGRKPISDTIRFQVFKKSGHKCVYCGRGSSETTLEIDHIVPVSKGGLNNIENLQTSCRRCNMGKMDKSI